MRRLRLRGARCAWSAVVVVFVLGSCAGGMGPKSTPVERRCGPANEVLEIGDPLPHDCTVIAFSDAKPVTLGVARGGKPMVLNFWASWCVYCIKEMPDFQRVYARAGGRVEFLGLDLLGVQGETEQAAKRLAAQTGVLYPLAYDRDGEFYRRVCPCGGRPLMPATAFVGSDGSLAYLKFGPLDAADLTSLIRTHLKVEI